jgi:NAD(P)-dependent dehydrogenase (short-subunit alcohol dehydrogenase family)
MYCHFAGSRASAGRNSTTGEELRTLAEAEHLALQVVDLDVNDDASTERAVQEVIAAAGRLDVVVNNAGVSFSGPLEAFTSEQAQRQFDTNVFGALRMNRAALPQMRSQGSLSEPGHHPPLTLATQARHRKPPARSCYHAPERDDPAHSGLWRNGVDDSYSA